MYYPGAHEEPWYEEEGKRLLHLGLSGSPKFRDDVDPDFVLELRARPESRLTDDRLVDTGKYSTPISYPGATTPQQRRNA